MNFVSLNIITELNCPKLSLSIVIGQETLLFYILAFVLVEINWYPGLLIGGDVFFSLIALERRGEGLYVQEVGPILCRSLLYELGHYFLDRRYGTLHNDDSL